MEHNETVNPSMPDRTLKSSDFEVCVRDGRPASENRLFR